MLYCKKSARLALIDSETAIGNIMKDYYFTLGGKQFWEDLFICLGWKIQRNITSQKMRLLDPWNIIRSEGDYQQCFDDFNKYAEAHELDIPENQHLIIMLHGFGQDSTMFGFIENELNKKGVMTAAINYPSMQRGLSGHACQLNQFVNNLQNVSSVSFVTCGVANIIVETAIAQKDKWQEKIKINKIIEINPLIKEDVFWNKVNKLGFLNFIFGPLIGELATDSISKFHHIPDTAIDVVITKPSRAKNLVALSLGVKTKSPTIDEIKSWCGTTNVTSWSSRQKSFLNSTKLIEMILNSLA